MMCVATWPAVLLARFRTLTSDSRAPRYLPQIVTTLGVNGKPTDASVDFRNDAEVKLGADFVVVASQAEPNRAHAFVETLALPDAAAVDGKGAAVDAKGATSSSSAVMVAMYPDLHPADDDDDADPQLCEVVFVVDRCVLSTADDGCACGSSNAAQGGLTWRVGCCTGLAPWAGLA